jgi:hypothetical protein
MPFFNNKRKDFSIQPPKLQVNSIPFFVTDSANIDFTFANNNLTGDLTLTGVTAGTYGDVINVPQVTVDQWGRITNITLVPISTSGLALETNGIPNGDQTLLNLVAGTNMTITDDGFGNITFDATGGGGSGTVTSVSAGTGMNFSTITVSGSVNIDTIKVPYLPAGFSTGLLKWNGSAWVFDNNTYLTTAVTSIGTAGLISGGTITSTGTITTSMNTNKLVGRGTAGVGIMEEITLGTGLSLSGTTLNATGGGGGIEYGVASGTNTYSVTISGVTSYTDGDTYVIKFTNGNDDDSSININGLGAKNLVKKVNVRVTGGDIVSGQDLIIIYDGTNFQTIGVAPNQFFAYVTNDDSVTITKGQPVYAFGAAGNRMSVKLASNTSDATSAQTVGVVFSSSIAANQRGFIITQGVIAGVNTSAYSPGAQLYLGATAGTLTATKPVAPNHLVYIGIVERANAGNGQIYIKPQNGYELDELHNVLITSPQNNQFLVYETGTPNLWKNKSLGTVLGGTTSQYIRGDGTLQTNAGSFGVTADGVGGVVQVGNVGYVVMTYAGTITQWYLTADVSGTVSFDITKSSGIIPTVSIIGGSNYPTLTSLQIATGTTFTSWTSTTFVAGDIFGFIIRSSPAPVSIKNVTLSLRVTKS